MLAGTKSDRILEALRRSPQPLDDDQLSERAEIGSWQQVNRICRQLEQYGRIRRIVGPDQRIVNEFVAPSLGGIALDSPEPVASGTVLGSTAPAVLSAALTDVTPFYGMVALAGPRSAVGKARPVAPPEPDPADVGGTAFPVPRQRQAPRPAPRDAQRVMLDLLGDQLGVFLEPALIASSSGANVEIDGADAGRTVLAACWTHQGASTPAHEHEVLADALKLSWIAARLQPRPRLVLCLGDPQAAEPFLPLGGSWAAQALQDLGISVAVVDLPGDVRSRARAAQRWPVQQARRTGEI